MFLDIFPMHEPETRTARRPVREPLTETGKSRSAWPFIVTGNRFGIAHAAGDSRESLPSVPVAVFPASCANGGASSFVT